jgi:hypothetical protein
VETLADDDADDDEEALADAELLADELALADDDDDLLGEDVGFADFVGVELAVVSGTEDGDSTVLGLGLVVAGWLLLGDGIPADELMCCTVLLPVSPLVWPCM